ncbi:hypothetical protein CGCA056_v012104 [Colletotrichum aenigma]|uniref:uncharacterized protein n=1 Tax=Colletotrichum aenigma TaxID=1215731 RepID=UPI00187315E2|nr:uncharacterized protein CGCA056_v012104 [Colletotrichum aenigma]KAF5512749.1 hypothetical protein CGCA056_v012104 [Colletotrichum aenigma]
MGIRRPGAGVGAWRGIWGVSPEQESKARYPSSVQSTSALQPVSRSGFWPRHFGLARRRLPTHLPYRVYHSDDTPSFSLSLAHAAYCFFHRFFSGWQTWQEHGLCSLQKRHLPHSHPLSHSLFHFHFQPNH